MLLDHYRLFGWSHCCSSYIKVFYYYPLPMWYSETLLSWDVVVSWGRPSLSLPQAGSFGKPEQKAPAVFCTRRWWESALPVPGRVRSLFINVWVQSC